MIAIVRATGTAGACTTGADDEPVPAGLIASIRTGSPVFMNGPEARNALELIVTVYEAARTGKRVVLGGKA